MWQYAETKILKRLLICAKFKKESTSLEKGQLLFGKGFNLKASQDFLNLLLMYIKTWAELIPTYPGNNNQTEFAKAHQGLIKEHIVIPSEEIILQSISQNYSQLEEDPLNSSMSSSLSYAMNSAIKDKQKAQHMQSMASARSHS
jgi:hypothetical protein